MLLQKFSHRARGGRALTALELSCRPGPKSTWENYGGESLPPGREI